MQVCMIHSLRYGGFYLGCVEIDTDPEVDESEESGEVEQGEPLEQIDKWWDEFQATKPDTDSQFVEWLVKQGHAEEVDYDHDSPNLPLQCYVGTPA